MMAHAFKFPHPGSKDSRSVSLRSAGGLQSEFRATQRNTISKNKQNKLPPPKERETTKIKH